MSAAAEAATIHPVTADLIAAAQRYRDRSASRAAWPPEDVQLLADVLVDLDEDVCRDVADRHERAPHLAFENDVARSYDRTKREVRELFDELTAAGFAVAPWLRPGQPYHDSRELVAHVRATRTIRVLLTRDAHGPTAATGFHPLREPAGVNVGGVELAHNDLVRAVHDLVGHVMAGTGFGAAGELKAAYCQMALHSTDVRRVLFAEHVAQTCWFYFGPHLRDGAGRLLRPGERGYVPPHGRPYPEQKVYAAATEDLEGFRRMFVEAA